MATQRGSDASNTASRSTKATAPRPQHQRPPLVAAVNAGKGDTALLVSFFGGSAPTIFFGLFSSFLGFLARVFQYRRAWSL